jgi:hypothetical protein
VLKKAVKRFFSKRGFAITFCSENKAQARQLRQDFHKFVATQQKILLSVAEMHLDSTIVEEEAMPWD